MRPADGERPPLRPGSDAPRWLAFAVILAIEITAGTLVGHWPALAACLMVSGAAGAAMLLRRMQRSIAALGTAMERVGAGNLDHRILTKDSLAQLGDMAAQFNAMAQQLEVGRERIENHAQELELRVDERTHELREAYEKLRTLDRAKEHFLSSISHEMQTPLTSITAAVEILENFVDDDPKTRFEFLTVIRRESQRLQRLIRDLLDMAKIEAEELVLRTEDTDLCELVDDVATFSANHAREANVAIHVRHPAGRIVHNCDRERIRQVVHHLVENAIKFSPVDATVHVTLDHDRDWIALRVRDEGPGVPERERDRLFGKFEQLGNVLTSKPRGVGIGLPIAMRLAQIHGGSLTLDDSVRGGAMFVLRLPARGTKVLPDRDETEPYSRLFGAVATA